jgi:hypothetical protein
VACKVQVRPGRCTHPGVGLSTADLHVVCPTVNAIIADEWKSAGAAAVTGGTTSPSPFARAGRWAGQRARQGTLQGARRREGPRAGPAARSGVGARVRRSTARSTAHKLAAQLTAPLRGNKANSARKGRRRLAHAALEAPPKRTSGAERTKRSRGSRSTFPRKELVQARLAARVATATAGARSRSHARANRYASAASGSAQVKTRHKRTSKATFGTARALLVPASRAHASSPW